jgi:hypothetical protein
LAWRRDADEFRSIAEVVPIQMVSGHFDVQTVQQTREIACSFPAEIGFAGWDLNQQQKIVGVCLRLGDRPDYSVFGSPAGEQPVIATATTLRATRLRWPAAFEHQL